MDVSNQHLLETIRHGHAIHLDKINPDSHIANGFWSREQMAVVLAALASAEQRMGKAEADLQRYADVFEQRGALLTAAQPVLDAAVSWLNIGSDERKAVAFADAEDVLATVVGAYVATRAPHAKGGAR